MNLTHLDPAHPGEHELVYCDWSAVIGPEDSIASAGATTISDTAGLDASASARLSGAAQVFAPYRVGQWVDGLVSGANYRLCFGVTTTLGRVLKAYAVLPVRVPS